MNQRHSTSILSTHSIHFWTHHTHDGHKPEETHQTKFLQPLIGEHQNFLPSSAFCSIIIHNGRLAHHILNINKIKHLKTICNLTTRRLRGQHNNITTSPPTQISRCINKHSTSPQGCDCFDISISTHGTLILRREEVISSEFLVVFVSEDYGYITPDE